MMSTDGYNNSANGRPPWEKLDGGQQLGSLDFSGGLQHKTESQPVVFDNTMKPWTGREDDDDEDLYGDNEFEPEDESNLEIYRKAERFKALNLLSGNSLPGGVTEEVVRKMYGMRGVQRFRLAKFILDKLGYQASPDVLLMLSCTNKARVIIATAGAGKTTSLQFDLLISKMLDKATGENRLTPLEVEGASIALPRILYLNYNKHNVQMILDRHTSMCRAVNGLVKTHNQIDDSIESSTVHAFCHKWLRAFASELSLPELKIISEDSKKEIWESIIKPRWEKFYGSSDDMVEYTVMDELYNFKTESMLDWDDFFTTAKFVDSGLKTEFVKRCIKKYDAMKKSLKVMDFTDYLIAFTEALKTNPELKHKLQSRYQIIIADENQDFTRLMNELLLQLYDRNVNELIVVGDPDQTIYDFKGVSPDNVVTLCDTLEDVQLLGLDTNYRCPDNIVSAAKKLLSLNILRFEKPINTVRTGGSILLHPCNEGENQTVQVVGLINRLSPADLASTVVTYRNNSSSLLIAEELYYANIPYKILDDRRPFNNSVFRQLYRALQALKEKDNFELNCELYRFLPLSKEQWCNILDVNRLNRHSHLHDVAVPQDLPRGTMEALRLLIRISNVVDKNPVCDYIQSLVKLYRMYYFDFIVKQTNYSVRDVDSYEMYLNRAIKFFSRQMTFDYMVAELSERNVDRDGGITLSTFHGLKGLEFDYVIAIDFEESIFPNYFGLEQRYSKNTFMEERESANRLCYVLVTRTIKELHLFYSATDPSVYVRVLTEGSDASKAESPKDELILGTVSDITSVNSKMSFVKRLLGDRG